MLHSHQYPFALQLLAKQCKFQIALGETFSGVVTEPVTTVPDLDRATAILALWNCAFEVTVIERMILNFDRKPFLARVKRWAARHRPRFKDTVKFQSEVIVQTRRVVL